jgi:hypothetical protein
MAASGTAGAKGREMEMVRNGTGMAIGINRDMSNCTGLSRCSWRVAVR